MNVTPILYQKSIERITTRSEFPTDNRVLQKQQRTIMINCVFENVVFQSTKEHRVSIKSVKHAIFTWAWTDRIALSLDKTKSWLGFAAGFLVVFRLVPALRFYLYNMDEGITLAVGALMAKGGLVYVDGICQRGPLLHGVAALTCLVSGGYNVILWNLTGLLFFTATTALVWLISKELFGIRVANLAAVAHVVGGSLTLMIMDSHGLNAEIFGNVPALGALYLLIRTHKSKGVGGYFLAGLLMMLAALFKQVFAAQAILIAFAATYDLFQNRKDSGSFIRFVLRGSLALFGFAIPLTVVIFIYSHAGHLEEFRFWFFTYNTAYAREGLARQSMGGFALWFFGVLFLRFTWLTLGAFFGVEKVFRPTGNNEKSEKKFNAIFVATWFFLALFSVLMAIRPFGYYFQLALPACSVFGAFGLVGFLEKKKKRPGRLTWLAAGFWGILILANLFLMVLSVNVLMQHALHGFIPGYGEKWEADNSVVDVASIIRASTNPDDTIFVWGFRPRLYPLSGRMPATKFISTFYLTGQYGGLFISPLENDLKTYIIPGVWKDAIRQLNENKPAVIVDASTAKFSAFSALSIEMFPLLGEIIMKNYKFQEVRQGFTVMKRNGRKWKNVPYDETRIYAPPEIK